MNNMPPVTKNLIIINLLFFLAKYVAASYNIDLGDWLGLHFFLASDFKLYQFFTYMFIHEGFQHILFNMFAVWMFGRIMENVWGPRRFLLFYIVCGVGAGITQEIVQYISYSFSDLSNFSSVSLQGMVMSTENYLNLWTTVGASGAVYGILLAFGMVFPNEQMFIFPLPVPIRAKYFVMGYAAIELFAGFGRSGDGVAHFAHLGGMIFGLLLILYWRNRGGGGYYRRSSSGGWKNKIFDWFKRFTAPRKPKMKIHMGARKEDYDYNVRKKEQSEEIDAILEKVKKKGYTSLSEEEKRKLFEASK